MINISFKISDVMVQDILNNTKIYNYSKYNRMPEEAYAFNDLGSYFCECEDLNVAVNNISLDTEESCGLKDYQRGYKDVEEKHGDVIHIHVAKKAHFLGGVDIVLDVSTNTLVIHGDKHLMVTHPLTYMVMFFLHRHKDDVSEIDTTNSTGSVWMIDTIRLLDDANIHLYNKQSLCKYIDLLMKISEIDVEDINKYSSTTPGQFYQYDNRGVESLVAFDIKDVDHLRIRDTIENYRVVIENMFKEKKDYLLGLALCSHLTAVGKNLSRLYKAYAR